MALKDITVDSLAAEKLVSPDIQKAVEDFIESQLVKPRSKSVRAISVSTENIKDTAGLTEETLLNLKVLEPEVLRDLVEFTVNTQLGPQGFKAETAYANDRDDFVHGYTINIEW